VVRSLRLLSRATAESELKGEHIFHEVPSIERAMMNLRIVKGTAKPGQVEALAGLWQETVGSKVAELPEFRRAYFAGDPSGTVFSVVTVWERFPDPAVSRQLLSGYEARVKDLIDGPLAVEEYTLFVEV
jgi:hypothetical protein